MLALSSVDVKQLEWDNSVFLASAGIDRIRFTLRTVPPHTRGLSIMDTAAETLRRLRANPKGIRYAELAAICDRFFGEPRQRSSSHRVYRTPWPGDPRVNIQNDRGLAKAYQVRQVIKAIERLEDRR